MDLLTYALAQQAIAEYGAKDAQIENITSQDTILTISLTDGRKFTVEIPTVSSGTVNNIVTEKVTEKVTEIKTQIQDLSTLVSNQSTDISVLQELTKNSVTQVSIGDTTVEIIDNTLNLPLASGEIQGFVIAKLADPNDSSSVNSISINQKGYMEVNSLSVDKLYQEEGDTLVLQCN